MCTVRGQSHWMEKLEAANLQTGANKASANSLAHAATPCPSLAASAPGITPEP